MNQDLKKDLQLIGKIKDAHGLKGEVLIIIFSKDYSPWLKLEQIYISPDENIPARNMKVLGIRHAAVGLIVRLDQLTDRTPAEKLKGELVFVSKELLKAKEGERIFLREILNFKVFDKKNLIGEISGFSSNGPQDLLLVTRTEKENPIQIPFVEAFIVNLDFKAKILKMDLPEGLLEVNEGRED